MPELSIAEDHQSIDADSWKAGLTDPNSKTVELTIVMPCLNEAETIEVCIKKARQGLKAAGVSGEILVADNGSTDASISLAEKAGARVVRVKDKGYGCALRGGIEAPVVNGSSWVTVMTATIFQTSPVSSKKFKEGYELVMGCRMPRGGGTVMPGAMPWKNRWLGKSHAFIHRPTIL